MQYNILANRTVYTAKSMQPYVSGNVKLEPWMHCIVITAEELSKSSDELVIFVWDTRKVIGQTAVYLPASKRDKVPGSLVRANDNGQPLHNCKLEQQLANNAKRKLAAIDEVLNIADNFPIWDGPLYEMPEDVRDKCYKRT